MNADSVNDDSVKDDSVNDESAEDGSDDIESYTVERDTVECDMDEEEEQVPDEFIETQETQVEEIREESKSSNLMKKLHKKTTKFWMGDFFPMKDTSDLLEKDRFGLWSQVHTLSDPDTTAFLFSRGPEVSLSKLGEKRDSVKFKTFSNDDFYGLKSAKAKQERKDFSRQQPIKVVEISQPIVPSKKVPLSVLLDWKEKGDLRKEDVDPAQLERYLTEDEFESVFGMNRDTFNNLPKWKRDNAKKQHKLY